MKYIIEFQKTGVICYTSHLDIMKVFKRAFKRAGITLAYSQGFNPHPKMGFAQPLSLGYWSMQEYIEFETSAEYDKKQPYLGGETILAELQKLMPEGLQLLHIMKADWLKKTLAADNVASEYIVSIPLKEPLGMDGAAAREAYMGQDAILAWKKQKKKKDLVQIDIKPKIRSLEFIVQDDMLIVNALLDSGSNSNLSPELVITTLLQRLQIPTERAEIQVMRKRMYFEERTQKQLTNISN